MKKVATIAVGLAVLQTAFGASVTLPTCGATCMVGAVSITTCSASEIKCLCTNSAYISKAVNCIHDQCSPADAENAYAYAIYACHVAGVEVPSVDSVLSSSPAPPPAATSAAPPPPPPPPPPPAPATSPAANNAPAPPPAAASSGASASSSSLVTVKATSAPSTTVATFRGAGSRISGYENVFVAVLAVGFVMIRGML